MSNLDDVTNTGRISIKTSSLYLLFDIEEHKHNHIKEK